MAAMRQFRSGQYASNGPRVPNYADGAVEAIRRIAPMLEKASGMKVLPKPEVRRSFVLNDASNMSNRYDASAVSEIAATSAPGTKKGNKKQHQE